MSSSFRMTPQKVSKEQKKKQKRQCMSEETDFLEVDQPIPGQGFVCMSFLSPESAIKERYLWYIKEFLNDLVAPIPQPEDMPVIEYKTKLHTILMKKFSDKRITSVWDDFLYEKQQELDSKYNDEVDFQTSTRGLKIRGTYSTYGEAKKRSNTIAKFDKNHHVYIGQVGYWLPWDPDPCELQDQEYQEKELNVLMKKYRENLMSKDQFFHERNREKMEAALRKNKDVKRIKEEDKETLTKVRNTIVEKNKIHAAIEAKKKETAVKETDVKESEGSDEKVSSGSSTQTTSAETTSTQTTSDEALPGSSQVSKDTVAGVFDKEDPWMQRKLQENKTKTD